MPKEKKISRVAQTRMMLRRISPVSLPRARSHTQHVPDNQSLSPFFNYCLTSLAKTTTSKQALESRCRFCLKEGTRCIFDQPPLAEDDVSLLEKVQSIMGIELSPLDGPPDKVCETCVEKIGEVYAFKSRVHNSQKMLRRQILGKNCRPGR